MRYNLSTKYTANTLFSIIFLLLFFPLMGNAMEFMNPLKACTFSEMNIHLTLDGKPAAGAKVIRSVNWKKEVIDDFSSDENGFVHLPATYESSITQVLPVEFVSSQLITVEHMNNEYRIWLYAKRNPKENFEMKGKPINLTCELSDTPKTERAFESLLKTSCKWN